MPVREYYKGKLVNYDWDSIDALAGVGGTIGGGAGGSRLKGAATTVGLGTLGGAFALGLSTLRSRELFLYVEREVIEDGSHRYDDLSYRGMVLEYSQNLGWLEPVYTGYVDADIGNSYRLHVAQNHASLIKRSPHETLIQRTGIVPRREHHARWEVLPRGKPSRVVHRVWIDGDLIGEAEDETTNPTGTTLRFATWAPEVERTVKLTLTKIRAWEP